MKLKKFLQSIEALKPTEEELTSRDLPLSTLDDWSIDVLKDEFIAFDGEYDQMVFCLDTITLFPGFRQLDVTDEDAPDPFIIFGHNSFYGFYYAYNYKNNEAVLLDDLRSPEPSIYVAASGPMFLDCLVIVAEYFKLRLLNVEKAEQEKDTWIAKATEAAGGDKYFSHCQILIG